MVSHCSLKFGPGRFAPAHFMAALAMAVPSQAQPPRAAAAAPSAAPVPDQLTALKMVWGLMAAVDQANRTGNYSVLRDLGTPGFQANNNPSSLGAIFANLRERGIDLSQTLIVIPNWEIPPRMVNATTLRMRGAFPLRPSPILFDLLFTWDRGDWRLNGIAVQAAR